MNADMQRKSDSSYVTSTSAIRSEMVAVSELDKVGNIFAESPANFVSLVNGSTAT